MKRILIVLPDQFSVRNFLYSPFIEQDFHAKGLEVVFLLSDPEAHAGVLQGRKGIQWDRLPEGEISVWERISRKFFYWLNETLNYRFSALKGLRHIWLKEQIPKEYLVSRNDVFPWYLKFPNPYSKSVYTFLYRLYHIPFGSTRHVRRLFQTYRPDALLTTNPQGSDMRPYYIEAQKAGVKTLAYINSWDYLPTDGPVPRYVDRFYLWNERMLEELRHLHQCEKQAVNVGPLHYDYSCQKDFVQDRMRTLETLGLPLDARYAVYGVCGERIGKHEPEVARYLAEQLQKTGRWLVVRGHPEDQTIPKRYADVLALPNVSLSMGQLFDGTQKTDERVLFYSLLTHADAVLCGPTTLILDAIRFDCPVVTIGFDGSLSFPPEASIASRFRVDHLPPLFDFCGFLHARHFTELRDLLSLALEHPEYQAYGRQRIRSRYLEPLDGKASDRLFQSLVDLFYEN